MSDTKITENDDDDLIVVETPPDDDSKQVEDDADDSEQGDERLAASDDDHEDEISTGTKDRDRERRRKRREIQKRARDAAQLELQQLRETVANLTQRIAVTESHATHNNVQTLEQRLAAAIQEVQQAEHIIARATEAGNGDDVVAALRMRDQAVQTAQQLQQAKQQYERAQSAPAPQVDPQVISYAKQWTDANPWYNPAGNDRDSAVAKAIDAELTREGFNPRSREYWEELTNRVSEALSDDGRQFENKPRRKGPPTGNTREHAPVRTKKEIYVTPERKQAMIEAGVWDDPIQRQRYLKAYQAYDTGSAR